MVNNLYQKGLSWFLSLSFKKRIAVIALSLALAGVAYYVIFNRGTAVITKEPSAIRAVSVASVSTIADSGAPLALTGEVKSLSEANIKTEAAGRITHVYKKIGDSVEAGEVIAEIENSHEMAALEQAKALLAQAEVSQNISQISQGSSDALLKEARNSAVNTLRSTYDGIEDILRNKLDPMFTNPQTSSPTFKITPNNSQLATDVNLGRAKVQSAIEAESVRRSHLSVSSDLLGEISLTESELAEIKLFIDNVNSALNVALVTSDVSQATIDAYKTTASTARTSWNTLMSTLSTTKDNLTAKTASFNIAQKQGSSSSTAVTTSSAAVTQAESGVQLARVALEKTIIRSPISGTINSLPITQGDFVSQLQPAVTVSNNQSLEIVAYVTDIDSRDISVGNKVVIQNTAEGVVTRVAPALDPLTKKIEVRIGVSKGLETLRNGQSVNLSIVRSKETIQVGSSSAPISIPIVSLKITPDGAVVFTLENGALKSHAVKIGALLGDRIVITEGLTPSMEIVTDARGLKDGQAVLLK